MKNASSDTYHIGVYSSKASIHSNQILFTVTLSMDCGKILQWVMMIHIIQYQTWLELCQMIQIQHVIKWYALPELDQDDHNDVNIFYSIKDSSITSFDVNNDWKDINNNNDVDSGLKKEQTIKLPLQTSFISFKSMIYCINK